MFVLKNAFDQYVTNRYGETTNDLNKAKTFKRVGDARIAKQRYIESAMCRSSSLTTLRPVEVAIMEILSIP